MGRSQELRKSALRILMSTATHNRKHATIRSFHKWKESVNAAQLAFSTRLATGGIEAVDSAVDEIGRRKLRKHRIELTSKVLNRLFAGVREAYYKHWVGVTRRGKERELGGEGFVKALARVLGRRRTERRRRAWDTWKVREMGERE